MRSIEKDLAKLDPLTRAALTRQPAPRMSPGEAEAIVRAREERNPCDLRVGWQVARARDAGAPIRTLPPLRLPGPITLEAHEHDERCRAAGRAIADVVFRGVDKVLARRAEGR